MWLQIWLWFTVVVYLCARVKWRQDLDEKMRQFKLVEEMQEKEAQAWNDFLKENQQVTATED